MRRLWLVLLLACCARGKPDVPILAYHSVGGTVSDYVVPITAFQQQLDWLATQGFRTVSLHELAESREGRAILPRRAIVLTFDDGKADALDVVLPELRKRGMRATFFIVTGFVGKPGYLTWEGVRALADAGMEIGSHTVDHARLTELTPEQVRQELTQSRRELEERLNRRIEFLAYPFNAVRPEIERAAGEAGYRIAVAGPVHGTADPLVLARIPVKSDVSLERFQRALR
jgi:peptidoglycan/xylan/chitin deacetylase (PgdA/CDA1 family)